MRDYQSDVLRALAMNLSLVYEGEYAFCPDSSGRYLDCFWEELNSCQVGWRGFADRVVVRQLPDQSVRAISEVDFPHWLWNAMYQSGAIRILDGQTKEPIEETRIRDQDQYLQIKVSVIRSILTKIVFRPRPFIESRAMALADAWRSPGLVGPTRPGLVVHIRRTDKLNDRGGHWRHIDFNSTRHMGDLIRQMEQSLGQPFGHFFIMSDDAHLLNSSTYDLKPFFGASSKPLVSKELCDVLGADASAFQGHESLDPRTRGKLYVSIPRPMIHVWHAWADIH